MSAPSREVAVDLFAVEAANKGDRSALENKADAVMAQANAVVFARGFEALEVGNLLKGSCVFDSLNDFPDSAKQRRVCNGGQICVEGLAESSVHAARASR